MAEKFGRTELKAVAFEAQNRQEPDLELDPERLLQYFAIVELDRRLGSLVKYRSQETKIRYKATDFSLQTGDKSCQN